ncbi:MAG: HPr family phosphocarrier protein [Polyangiaceae bacterium]|jgi:phosphocarrier protein HPr
MSDRATGRFTIVNTLGLHARAATKLVQLASRFPCEVEISRDDQAANGKSVMGVLLLCGSKGTVLDVRASGERAQECVDAVGELIANRFGEPS